MLLFWWYKFLFSILIGTPVDVSSICLGVVDLLTSSQEICEAIPIALLAILSPIKSPVAFTVFWITIFEAVLRASVADFLCYQEAFTSSTWWNSLLSIHI